jgi:hypothetical protein
MLGMRLLAGKLCSGEGGQLYSSDAMALIDVDVAVVYVPQF